MSRRRRERPVAARPRLTLEHLAYIGLGVLSILLHLWALDRRALHHDETIHAFFSWNIATGKGYVHDPLTHGPFLYYWTALQYTLFGDNEFTARLSAAIFGVALTLMPWLLRPSIGRGPAFLASVYLTISPVVLYVGRFIRHDIFAVTWELLCLIAIVRYAATYRSRWIYIFWASLALMYATIETSYLFTLTLGTFVALITLWRIHWRLLIALGVFGIVALGALVALPKHQGLHVQADTQGGCEIKSADGLCFTPILNEKGERQYFDLPLVTSNQALVVRNQGDDRLLGPNNYLGYIWAKMFGKPDDPALIGEPSLLGDGGYLSVLKTTLFGSPNQPTHDIKGRMLFAQNGVFLHPGVAVVTVLTLLFLVGIAYFIWFYRRSDQLTLWYQARERNPDDVWLKTLETMWNRHTLFAVLIGFFIYAMFFTSFGVHTSGVVSGVTGSLLYWMAQHDVQRGGQPQHYYFVQLLVYEPLLLTLGIGSMLAGVIHLARRFVRNQVNTARALAPGLLAWWAGGSLALYTWAGEKMPWITLHVAAPLALIMAWGAWTIGAWAFSGRARGILGNDAESMRHQWRGLVRYVGAAIIVTLFGTIILTRQIRQTDSLPDGSPFTPWLLLIILGIWAVLTIAYALFYGRRRAVGAALVAVMVLWGSYTFRSAWRLNYENGDVPVEMMVYVQTSPDVTRIMRGLEKISVAETGNMDLVIMNDNEQIWWWYTRNYPKRVQTGGPLSSPAGEEVAAVLLIQDNWGNADDNLKGFVSGRFPLRWWFPEHFYRFATRPVVDEAGQTVLQSDGEPVTEPAPFNDDSTIGRLIRRPWDSKTQNELWRYLLFRQPPGRLEAVDFKVYVRPKYAYMLGLPGIVQAGDSPLR